ncbi:adhesion G protein-coupled receptor B3-like [Nannospalax galili]|uniref:adhesion G protein-coupled receptor B3-like n=1 Tax=Nannospalax galili TaxID=1026970 RepID=UPI000819DF52|nr:adhesion G protein-coupled receptor B3-like [Nannospalax galili]
MAQHTVRRRKSLSELFSNSNLLDEENKEKWEDAQQFDCSNKARLADNIISFSIVASIQKHPAASVLTDINFPMKGQKAMVDWARNSEDRVVIPKSIFTSVSSKELDESSVFVLGAVLYKNLDLILSTLRNYTVVNSKTIVVTIRPEPKTTDSFLEIELAHLTNIKILEATWKEK